MVWLGLGHRVAMKFFSLSGSDSTVDSRGVVAGAQILVEDGALGAVEGLHAAVIVAEKVTLHHAGRSKMAG